MPPWAQGYAPGGMAVWLGVLLACPEAEPGELAYRGLA